MKQFLFTHQFIQLLGLLGILVINFANAADDRNSQIVLPEAWYINNPKNSPIHNEKRAPIGPEEMMERMEKAVTENSRNCQGLSPVALNIMYRMLFVSVKILFFLCPM
jgi:hypothetical protein